MSVQPKERSHLDVKFRGQTYRITLDHAHMLNLRGHLRSRQYAYNGPVEYTVEDDRHIEVSGAAVSSGGESK